MISQPPVALDYEVATVFYPRLRDVPRWWMILIALLFVPLAAGWWMVSCGGLPITWQLGTLCLAVSAPMLIALILLYVPAAT